MQLNFYLTVDSYSPQLSVLIFFCLNKSWPVFVKGLLYNENIRSENNADFYLIYVNNSLLQISLRILDTADDVTDVSMSLGLDNPQSNRQTSIKQDDLSIREEDIPKATCQKKYKY